MNRFAKCCLIGLALVCFSPHTPAQTPTRETLLQEIQSQTAKLKDLTQEYLKVSPEEQSLYTEFLTQSNTGIVRLLPREAFNDSQEVLLLNGGGSYYSFTRRTHEYNEGADIVLRRGLFSAGIVDDNFGILANLGQIPVSQITVESPQTKFLISYQPPENGRDYNFFRPVNGSIFSKGVISDGRTYNRTVSVEVNSAYLLRSINYNSNSDILVAFQVVKKDFDGSILLVWRRLQEFPKPLRIRQRDVDKGLKSYFVITEKQP